MVHTIIVGPKIQNHYDPFKKSYFSFLSAQIGIRNDLFYTRNTIFFLFFSHKHNTHVSKRYETEAKAHFQNLSKSFLGRHLMSENNAKQRSDAYSINWSFYLPSISFFLSFCLSVFLLFVYFTFSFLVVFPLRYDTIYLRMQLICSTNSVFIQWLNSLTSWEGESRKKNHQQTNK